MTVENQKVHCLTCNKPVRGRTDKKYCDDYCRNTFNNRLKSSVNNLVRNINNALVKNRRILERFFINDEETTKTTKEKLLQEGFQFKYVTHTCANKKGNIYFFCYDLGYLPLENNWYLLVKRRDDNCDKGCELL
jgi:predicted nucleic acid-binding Zn ribbon protein